MTTSNRVARVMLLLTTAATTLVFTACPPSSPPLNPLTLLPTDAGTSCVVSSSVFATWFQSGTVSSSGVVNPANSVTFPNSPNCSFYQWAKQDFLWLTSPTTSAYGGSGLIMDSPAFFDVSPPATDGSRTFLAHSSGFIRPFALRAAQAGPKGLQLTFDRTGKPLQVQLAEKGARPLVRDVSGQTVEIAHVRRERDGKLTLLDANGKVIQALSPGAPKEDERVQIPQMLVAQKFMIDGFPIFIDPSLEVIDVEQGEAITDGVLEAQTTAGGSLVYYATIVNDVYAYYATGVNHNAISLAPGPCPSAPPATTCFPTTQADLNKIVAFATGHTTFPDPTALAIEVKSAWVDASGLSNPNAYITMSATIPTYTHTSSTVWTGSGQQTVRLALVGMHVVGSVAGHPEMIWSTFEHVANAPSATYSYVNTSGAIATVNQNASTLPVIQGTSTPWLFSATNATSFNNQNMSSNPPNITANPPSTISPSDTIRWKAFGGAIDVSPNPVDKLPPGGSLSTDASDTSNSEIISINNSVLGMLPASDVRNNYVMTGATWTINGFAPIGTASLQSCSTSFADGCQVGTSALANTTMETYQQGKDNTLAHGGTNCFSCHTNNTTDVSHVFGVIKPLF